MLVTMTHEDRPGYETAVQQTAYRYTWYPRGWRSDDDPDWDGIPPPEPSYFRFTGDMVITGEIRTGTFGAPATFGGIEREARLWPAGEMMSPTGQINFGDGWPRLNMPAGIQTDAYMVVEIEEWWLDHTIGVYFEWTNDHSAGGNVRWDVEFSQINIATQTIAAATTLRARTFTATAPAPDVITTGIIGRVLDGTPIDLSTPGPGTYASVYCCRISRLGGATADTLAGPVGLLAANMTRGQ